ncbi:sulfotransferase [Persicobacter psychrovividus]|uniref:Sulfotransferase family protein n=1 Tax=Persicobacter psychrovividus TaxID=387638 RepID=A0ABN6LDA7_9BACT|nr:sulfotransferase family protein [Persicobacter psychrovividus]
MSNEFKLPAISALAGSTPANLSRVVAGRSIASDYKTRLAGTKVVSRLTSPIAKLEAIRNAEQIEAVKFHKAPVFILGHWRSGTTHLHNLMCQDPQFGYVTTYQGVFPNALLSGQWLMKSFMNMAMPKKRATDNVELNVNFPQEEEFALGNMCPHSFYNFWYFPQNMQEYADRYLLFKGIDIADYQEWKIQYDQLVRKAMINTNGERFISKNPPHTSRIKALLELYPNAKFIHIARNPYTVFESTVKFFMATIEPLKFQDISKEEMEENILSIYAKMYDQYEAQKALIPEGNLVEIRFEDLEKDNMGMLEQIYQKLDLGDFEKVSAEFQQYVDAHSGYKKNQYNYAQNTLDKVSSRWSKYFKRWGYEL